MRFLVAHWRGELPLKISLWINLVGLLALLAFIEPLVLAEFSHSPDRLLQATLISLLVTRLIIFPWQAIGLVRSSDRHFLQYRNGFATRGVYIAIILSLAYTFMYIIGTLQTVLIYKAEIESMQRNDRQTGYSISLSADGRQLKISGALDIGITREVEKTLLEHAQVDTVLLDSIGGQIYQGRGIAQSIIKRKLRTLVLAECSSACTTAFIAGTPRVLGPEGRLGFHRYRLEDPRNQHLVPLYRRLREEQMKDLDFFRQQGIDETFLARIFSRNTDEMWFPSTDELLQMRVVDELLP